MATAPVKTLVTLDAGVDRNVVESALQLDQSIQIVGFVEGLEEGWETLLEVQADLLVIACSGYSERTLVLAESSRKQRPSRPVVVLCEGSPNGFVRRVFEAGVADIVTAPRNAGTDRVRAPESRRAQAGHDARDEQLGGAGRLRPRSEGRHREDTDLGQPRGVVGRDGREGAPDRPRPPVRRRRALHGALAGQHDRRPRPLRRLARLGEARGIPRAACVGGQSARGSEPARSGERGDRRVPP